MTDHRERACPDCGSPSRANPCWYEIKHPGYQGDRPCDDYFYAREDWDRQIADGRRVRRTIVVALLILVSASAPWWFWEAWALLVR